MKATISTEAEKVQAQIQKAVEEEEITLRSRRSRKLKIEQRKVDAVAEAEIQ